MFDTTGAEDAFSPGFGAAHLEGKISWVQVRKCCCKTEEHTGFARCLLGREFNYSKPNPNLLLTARSRLRSQPLIRPVPTQVKYY